MRRPLSHLRPFGPLFAQSGGSDIKERSVSEFNEVFEQYPIRLPATMDGKGNETVIPIELPKDQSGDDVIRYTEAKTFAHDMIKLSVDSQNVNTMSPSTLAGSAYYATALVTNYNITQNTVADLFDITEPTIRRHYSDMLDMMEEAALNGELE